MQMNAAILSEKPAEMCTYRYTAHKKRMYHIKCNLLVLILMPSIYMQLKLIMII